MQKGKIIGGELNKLLIRKKAETTLEIGELLIAQTPKAAYLIQITNISYGSQIAQQNLHMIAGMALEEDSAFQFFEEQLRNYELAEAKPLLTIQTNQATPTRSLPDFFVDVKEITQEDVQFLSKKDGMHIGNLRSGSAVLDVPIKLNIKETLSHHVLIPATTGKGKSNLMSHLLWNTLPSRDCAMLVLDPHDEYYGHMQYGLKDHPEKEKTIYYTAKQPEPGQYSLKINIAQLKPSHFSGVLYLTGPQQQCCTAYYNKYQENWIEHVFRNSKVPVFINEESLGVVQRKLSNALSLSFDGQQLISQGIFSIQAGQTTLREIQHHLESASTVIIDTSHLSSSAELIIGSLLAHQAFTAYKKHNTQGMLAKKPVISIVLEEAPRVLGKEVLERGGNIFSTIAREGRKFQIGLCAITQLPSLIPKDILANMNTKIILGIEMGPERQAIIDSAAQDLSDDNRNIAALNKGEAIITSNFTQFATPIYIPLFKKTVEETLNNHNAQKHGVSRKMFTELQQEK